MRIHLSKYDVMLLRDKALESVTSEDGGEAFCEEAVRSFEDPDIETIESRAGGSADDFMLELFAAWDQTDPIELVEALVESLANIDIDLTFDDLDGDEEIEVSDDDDDWEEEEEEEGEVQYVEY